MFVIPTFFLKKKGIDDIVIAFVHPSDLSSVENLSKQFGPKSGLIDVGPDLDPNSLTL